MGPDADGAVCPGADDTLLDRFKMDLDSVRLEPRTARVILLISSVCTSKHSMSCLLIDLCTMLTVDDASHELFVLLCCPATS